MINLHRTTDDPPLAVLSGGSGTILFPWEELLALRELVSKVPVTAAADPAYEGETVGRWQVRGSARGLALSGSGYETLFFVGDDLLLQTQVAEIASRPYQRVAEAIGSGALFAFQVPGLKRRQWRVPRTAAEKWAEEGP